MDGAVSDFREKRRVCLYGRIPAFCIPLSFYVRENKFPTFKEFL